jgi:hypothetical protein
MLSDLSQQTLDLLNKVEPLCGRLSPQAES